MNIWVTIGLQSALTVLNVLAGMYASDPQRREIFIAAISAVQAALAAVAHQYNPDGTSAKTAYIPKQGG